MSADPALVQVHPVPEVDAEPQPAPVQARAEHGITASDVYHEMMNQIRYYGGVRYILLPVFIGATATLVDKFYSASEVGPPAWLIGSGGLLIAIVFLAFEQALSDNLRLLWDEVEKAFKKGSPWPGINPVPHRGEASARRSGLAQQWWVVLLFRPFALMRRDRSTVIPLHNLRVILHSPYYVATAFWLYQLVAQPLFDHVPSLLDRAEQSGRSVRSASSALDAGLTDAAHSAD